jgi:hypothetical protein
VSATSIEIPKGRLVFAEGREPIAYLSASRAARKATREWFDRLSATCTGPIVFPRRLADGPKGFEIHYQEEPRGTVGLRVKVGEWAEDLPASVPLVFQLGRFVLETAHELSERSVHDALIAPGLIRFAAGLPDPWRLLPLPCGAFSVADWAQADPDTWQWLSSENVLGSPRVDPVRGLGAALHHALVGSLFPATLSGRDRFARLLRGRVGMSGRLNAALAAAVPHALGPDAAELERLVLECLQSPALRRLDEDQTRTRFEELVRKLAIDRLVRYWGFENQPEIAARLAALQRLEEAAPETLPRPARDWADVAEDRIKEGDLMGALEAAWNVVRSDGPWRARLYLSVVQRVAARFLISEATAAINRIVQQYGDKLDEADALRLIHLRLRYLNDPAIEPALLNRRYASTWNEATARLIQAWLVIRSGTSYNQVSKLCREARKLYEAMPERGGEAGLYATAYLHLLDGIAHIGAVSVYSNASFYTDAFEHFGKALELATSISAEDEIRASFHWLGWLAQFTRLYPDPPLSLVYAGIDAILRSQGLSAESYSKVGIPEIPRYNEDRIFPL